MLFGSSFIGTRNQLALAAQTDPTADSSYFPEAPPFAIKSPQERKWKKWRESEDCSSALTIPKHWGSGTSNTSGISLTPSTLQDSVWQQEAGPTVFAPFKETTSYFGDPQKVWMVNFRVRDLDKMAAQLQAAGIEIKIDPQAYPNGRFARLHDPEGNPIELWQPK